MMLGWTIDGRQIELLPPQEKAVKQLLGDRPADESLAEFFRLGKGAGKTTVLITAAEYSARRSGYHCELHSTEEWMRSHGDVQPGRHARDSRN